MKLYTIDNALLTECPEIRIGDKVYPLDDRQKTAEKVMKLIPEDGADSRKESMKMIREAFALVFGHSVSSALSMVYNFIFFIPPFKRNRPPVTGAYFF